MPTIASIIRLLAALTLIGVGVADYGFDVLAKPIPDVVYAALASIAAGVDIKSLRNAILRLIGGGK